MCVEKFGIANWLLSPEFFIRHKTPGEKVLWSLKEKGGVKHVELEIHALLPTERALFAKNLQHAQGLIPKHTDRTNNL